METRLKELKQLLAEEMRVYRALRDTIQAERLALVRVDLDTLKITAGQKEEVLGRLCELESERARLVSDMADMLGVASKDLTLDRLCHRVPESVAGELQECRRKLIRQIESVRCANRRNDKMFTHSLELIRGSYNFLRHLTDDNPIYFRGGCVRQRRLAGRLLQSEI